MILLPEDGTRLASPGIMKRGDAYHLLVVDDERSILFAMTRYFTNKGFVVETAEDPPSALTLVTGKRYDVAIVDLRLSPEADYEGMQVVKALHREQPDCSIMVLTAYGSDEIHREAREHNVAAFLKKPQRLPELLELVLGLLHNGTPQEHDAEP